MAEYRPIHTGMWNSDDWFAELKTDQRLLWVYLLTNPRATTSGLYPFPLRFAPAEVGLSESRILAILDEFSLAGKARYEEGYVWVVNMRKYASGSEKLQKGIQADLNRIPNIGLKTSHMLFYKDIDPKDAARLGYDIDTIYSPAYTISTKRNVTKQTKQTAPSGARGAAAPADDRFEEFWTLVVRKDEKQRALRHWRAILKAGVYTADDLISAMRYYNGTGKASNRAPEHYKGGANWLSTEDGYYIGVIDHMREDDQAALPAIDLPPPDPKTIPAFDRARYKTRQEELDHEEEEIRQHKDWIERNTRLAGKRRADRDAANRAVRGQE